MKKVIGLFFVVTTLAGCDFELPWNKRARVEATRADEKAEQAKVENESRAVKGECASLIHYINTERALLEGACADAEKARAKVEEARSRFSARLTELTATNVNNAVESRIVTLLAIMKDEQVNALARAFLGRDFAVMASDVGGQYQLARQEAAKRRRKLAQNEAEYKAKVSSANERVQQTLADMRRGVADIEREITRLESRRKSLMAETLMSNAQRQRIRDELSTINHRLTTLRGRLDSLKATAQSDQRVRSAVQAAHTEQQWAARQKVEADKGIAEVEDGMAKLADETSEKTIRALDAALAARDADLNEQIADARKKISFLSATMTGLESLDRTGLRDVRKRVEVELAKTARPVKK